MATQIMQALGPNTKDNAAMRPLPSLPSPTLTNPDMVLPNEPSRIPSLPSPPRNAWRERPPSLSYLRDKPNEGGRPRTASGASGTATPVKKEKRGLMSRKMMLLRSRTASNGIMQLNGNVKPVPRSVASEEEPRGSADYGSGYASSPTLMDVGNLAPEQPEERRISTSAKSFASDEMNGMQQFLAKYDNKDEDKDELGTDDELENESPATQRHSYSASIENGLDAQRRQQEEDEHNSAILSKRAEEILANAKKRLNVRN